MRAGPRLWHSPQRCLMSTPLAHPARPAPQDVEKALIKQDRDSQKDTEKRNTPAMVAKALQLNEAATQKRRGKMIYKRLKDTKLR